MLTGEEMHDTLSWACAGSAGKAPGRETGVQHGNHGGHPFNKQSMLGLDSRGLYVHKTRTSGYTLNNSNCCRVPAVKY